MFIQIGWLPRIFTGVLLGLFLNTSASAQTIEDHLINTLQELETNIGARIGVVVRDSASDWELGYRQDEKFLMASTFKSVLCGAVLERVDHGEIRLDERLDVREKELVEYSPVTGPKAEGSMTVEELCIATLDMSDNTAANILIDRLGGTQDVTAFLRRIGDPTTRLDRKEPELNLFVPGDVRDTTSPSAMASTWNRMLLGEALSPASRVLLADWLSRGGVTGELIRASTPATWRVADKSGGGRDHTRNLVAMITPPNDMPYFVSIYVSDTPADWELRNSAVKKIGVAIVNVLQNR